MTRKVICAKCKCVFETDVNMDDVKEKLKKDWGNVSIGKCESVCEECFKEVCPDYEEYKEYKEWSKNYLWN